MATSAADVSPEGSQFRPQERQLREARLHAEQLAFTRNK